jgi:transposase
MSRQPRYPSDLSNEQWALVETLLPPPRARWATGEASAPGRSWTRSCTGCAWWRLPADFPPWQTVYWYFVRWEDQQVSMRMLAVLREQLRAERGRDAQAERGDHRLPESEVRPAVGVVGPQRSGAAAVGLPGAGAGWWR